MTYFTTILARKFRYISDWQKTKEFYANIQKSINPEALLAWSFKFKITHLQFNNFGAKIQISIWKINKLDCKYRSLVRFISGGGNTNETNETFSENRNWWKNRAYTFNETFFKQKIPAFFRQKRNKIAFDFSFYILFHIASFSCAVQCFM